MRFPRAWTSGLVLAVLCGALFGPQAQADMEAPPARDFDSPYLAILEAQLPNYERPWQKTSAANRDAFAKAYAAGLRWTYTWVAYSDIAQPDGSYDEAKLQQLDQYLRDLRAEGLYVKIQVMVGPWGAPVAADPFERINSRHPLPPSPAPVTFDGIRDFWVTLVERYRPGGALAQQEGWTEYGVRHWEVENEPDSMVWPNSWQQVPKDYAEYLSVIHPAIEAVDPEAIVSAPALSHQASDVELKGVAWLDEVLSPGGPDSEWASDTYRDGAVHPSGGPFIDAYSFHRNNPSISAEQAPERATQLREVVARHVDDPTYPTSRDPVLWYSEGGTLQYSSDPAKFARAQVQLQSQLHGAGVERMVWAIGAERNNANGWEGSPMFHALRAYTQYIPRAGQTVRADADIDPEQVTTYRRTDPDTGARTWVLWAHDLPDNSSPGPEFTVTVPARDGPVEVVRSANGYETEQATSDGGVDVTVHAEDISPVVIVAEVLEDPPPVTTGTDRAVPAPGSTGDRPLPVTGNNALLILAAFGTLALAVASTRLWKRS